MSNNRQFRTLLWLAISLQELYAFPFPIPFLTPYTSHQDVYAINDLYACLGSPVLGGWTASGGDPCKEAWQGVQCVGPNITLIELRGASLEGKLSETLGNFTSITRLDLSNNHIGGAIPWGLPPAIRELDVSSNNLSGELPSSMAKLKSLSTLYVENNRLTGTLDVIGDLPLKDLNVENNLFSGSIPQKLISVPNFLRSGNHFTVPLIPGFLPTPEIPSPLSPPPPPTSTPDNVPAPAAPQGPQHIPNANPAIVVTSATPQEVGHDDTATKHKKKVPPAQAVGYSVLAAGSLTVAVLLVVFSVSKWKRGESFHRGYLRGVEMSTPRWMKNPPGVSAVAKSGKEHNPVSEEKIGKHPSNYSSKITGSSLHPLSKKSSTDDIASDEKFEGTTESQSSPFSFTSFTVSSLQQYTDSFSDRNLIRETSFGKIYLAEHPESKFAVLKLDDKIAKMPADDFLKLVQNISELQHPNIEELVGCCTEYGQRLLVYRYFSENTLDGMIHFEDDPAKRLTWDARISVAIQAAKAVEYLHEGCQKQVVHQNFRPEHVLVDSELRVRVSGCGLAPFLSSSLVLQLSDWYDETLSCEPPEVAQSLPWTAKGDIYCFGVVMLQLLTGRRPYDSSRRRGQKRLVTWASSQLYDLNALKKMADPCLSGCRLPVRSLSRFADVISRCIQQEAEFRPVMSQLVQDLKRTLEYASESDHAETFFSGSEEI